MVVSNIFYFHPGSLGKISTLTNISNIFQRGWFNHQPGLTWMSFRLDKLCRSNDRGYDDAEESEKMSDRKAACGG